MPRNPANDDVFASVGVGPDGGGLYDQAVEFLRPARAFFGASQNVGGQLAGMFTGDDIYRKAVDHRLKGAGATGESSDLQVAESLPGAGDVFAEAVPEETQKNPYYRAVGEPVLRLAGNIAGDPTNLMGAGAIARGVGHLGAVAFAPDIVKGAYEGVGAIRKGIAEGDTAGAVGGGVQTALSAGLAALIARGMIHPQQAEKAALRHAAENGDMVAAERLKAQPVEAAAQAPVPEAPPVVEQAPTPSAPVAEPPQGPVPANEALQPMDVSEGFPVGGTAPLDIPFPGPNTLTLTGAEAEGLGLRFQAKRRAAEEATSRDAKIKARAEELAAAKEVVPVPEEATPIEPVLSEPTVVPEAPADHVKSPLELAAEAEAKAAAEDEAIATSPVLPPAPEHTISPAAGKLIDAADTGANDTSITNELASRFAKLQERAVASMSGRPGADPVALEKAAGDSFLESLGTFKPSEGALELWAQGKKDRLFDEFRSFAKGNMRRRMADAFTKKAAATVPDAPIGADGKKPSDAIAAPEVAAEPAFTLADQLEKRTDRAAAVEETVKGVVKKDASVQENHQAVIAAMAENHPDLLKATLKNPGKGGDAAGEGFKTKAWNAWALKQAQPGLQNKEIAALLGVNKTQVTKYLQAVEEAIGTSRSQTVAAEKAAANIKFQGKFRAGETRNSFAWEGPNGEKAKIFRGDDGTLTFEVPGKLDLRAALDGIGLVLQHSDYFNGKIDLGDLSKNDLSDLLKAGFVKSEGDFWKVLPATLKTLHGGLGFVPPPRLAALVGEIGEQGLAAVRRGAELLMKGADAAGVWGARMLREFGPGIKKFLGRIYDEVKKSIKSFSFGELPAGEEAARQAGPGASMLGAGQIGDILKDMFKGVPKAQAEKAAKGTSEAAQAGLRANPRETPPGRPGGEPLVNAEGKKVPVSNVAHNTYQAQMSKKADSIAVKVMEYVNPMMERATKQSEKEWIKKATNLLGVVDPDTFILHMSNAKGVLPEEAIGLRQLAKEAWESMSKAKDALVKAGLSGDAEQEATAARAYLEAARDSLVGGSVAGNWGTRAGRLLRSFGVMLNLDPKNYKTNKMVDALREIGLTKDQANHLFDLWQTGQYEAFTRGVHIASDPTLPQMALEAWKAALLTPASHAANTGSNFAIYLLRGRERTMAAGLDRLRVALMGGDRDIYRMPTDLGWAAAQDAMATGWPKFIEDVTNSLKAKPLRVQGPADIRQAASALPPNKVGEFLKFNFKVLDAADSVGKLASLYRNSGIFAWTEAMLKSKGDKAKAREIFPKLYEEIKDYTRAEGFGAEHKTYSGWDLERLKNKSQRALKLMDQDTFKEDLTGALRSFAHGIRDSILLSVVAPFTKTPINIARETARRTPIGLWLLGRKIHTERVGLPLDARVGHNWWDQIKTAASRIGPEEIEDDLAKSLAGTVGGYLVLNMLGNHLTGGGPSDPKKQEQLKRTGWQPYSIKVGDQFVSYQRFEPISAVVGMAADIKEGMQYGEFDKAPAAAKRLVATLTENMTNKTFLAGLEGLFTMWSDPQRYADRWVKQLQGSAIPNTVGYLPFGVLARAMDPTYRQTEAFTTGPFKAKIPGLSQTLEPQLGPTGEERERGETFVERLASPVRRSEVRKDPGAVVASEADRVGYVLSAPKRYQAYGAHKVDYTKEELKFFVDAQQQGIDRMSKLVRDPSYLSLPDNEEDPKWQYGRKTKQEVMRDLFLRFRRTALQRVKPEVLRRGKSEYGGGSEI